MPALGGAHAPTVSKLDLLGTRLRCEKGLTLIELLVAMAISLIVGAAAMMFMIVSIDQSNAITSRAAATEQAEVGVEQLVRDLRGAMSQDSSGGALNVTVNIGGASTWIVFDIPNPANSDSPEQVTWTCPSAAGNATNVGVCTRIASAGTQAIQITGVQQVIFSPRDSSGQPMTFSPGSPATNPSYVDITLYAQVISQLDTGRTHIVRGANSGTGTASTKPIMIQTGADLRNFG